MSDDFTEITNTSLGGNLMNSIKGIIFGVILFIASFILLFWNEGRAVKVYKALAEGLNSVVTVSSDKVESKYEGKLVHITGKATSDEVLTDPEFNISIQAIMLKRTVQMYQWEESETSRHEKKMGGGTRTITTYKYKKIWSSSLISSSKFKKINSHKNPNVMKYSNAFYVAKKVTLGKFEMSFELIKKMDNFQKEMVTKKLTPEFKIYNGDYYYGQDPSQPKIGDLKIQFSSVKPAIVSIVSKQRENSFEAYQTKVGKALNILVMGNKSAENIFASERKKNANLTWILRLVGFLMMTFGMYLCFNPLVALSNILPFLGDIIGMGIGIVSLLIALILSFITIAIAWIFYRPLLGFILLVIAGGLFFGLKQMGAKKNPKRFQR